MFVRVLPTGNTLEVANCQVVVINQFSIHLRLRFGIGQAIKKARTAKGMTRDELSRIVDYDPRHLQAVENEGQKPSLEPFIQLVTMFAVSVDEYIFPDKEVKKSSVRRRLDAELDKLNDKELSVIEATVIGLCKAKEPED